MTSVENAGAVAAGQPQAARPDQQEKWDPRSVQEKWLAKWDEMDLFLASDDPADTRPRSYVLDMFPYPSGDLHMGHAEAYAVADAMARFYFQRGHNVLAPDRLGRLRPARRERRDQGQLSSSRLDLQEHRGPGRVLPAVRAVVRLDQAPAHL